MKYQVFWPDKLLKLARYDNLDRGGHFNIQHAPKRPNACHFRRANPKRKCSERSVACRMRIRAHHHLPGTDVAVLRQNLMADPSHVTADIMELSDTLQPDELAYLFLVRCCLRRFGRNAMIENHRYA